MEKATIYCVKTGETIHYIGKTISAPNTEGEMCNSSCHSQYTNPDIREVFINNTAVVEPMLIVDHDKWYDEKLREVVEKHKDLHPLRNAQWMLDGKRGYWEGTDGYWIGKTRDRHTIDRMCESKFKPVLEYDEDGNFVRQWESRKAVGLAVFGDYRVINGGGNTKFYAILNNKNPKKHLRHGSYWFDRNDFKKIPQYLDIEAMYQEFKKTLSSNRTHHPQYTIEWYVDGKLKKTFNNAYDAAKRFKLHPDAVRKICKGRPTNTGLDLKYGPKKLQLIRKNK